jgi:uncharacterized protein (TIGR00255 family)
MGTRAIARTRRAKRGRSQAPGAVGVRSMSGFGTASGVVGPIVITIDLRAVNSRFFDCGVKFSGMGSSISDVAELENEIRSELEAALVRGRVDSLISISTNTRDRGRVSFNEKLFLEAFKTVRKSPRVREIVDAEDLVEVLLSRSEILEIGESTIDRKTSGVTIDPVAFRRLLRKAIEQLQGMRAREGDRLSVDVVKQIGLLDGVRIRIAAVVTAQQPALKRELTSKLDGILARISQLPASQGKPVFDPGRLEQEIAVTIAKTDVHEELVRLESHTKQFLSLMKERVAGKRLDFLTQEFLRELNTVGSKIAIAQVQHLVVDGKGIVERIREQVQNLV